MKASNDWWPIEMTRIQIAIALLGVIVIVFSFSLDSLGFGSPGSFGIGQAILLTVGILGLLTGLLGRKVITLYKGFAIILLNTLILLALVELAAIVFARSGQNYDAQTQALPYYAEQDWTAQYFSEAFAAEVFRYEPYVTWRHKPFDGDLMNLNHDGFRETPGATCTDNAFEVFAFGGSTMLGWGSPDWGTIPAYLQAKLSEKREADICVINFGQSGYVSTQSLVALLLELQAGNFPDLVIFYDGVNEVQAAYESGLARVHVNLAPVADRFEQREHPLVSFIKTTRTYALVEDWVISRAKKQLNEGSLILDIQMNEAQIEELSDSVTEIYLNNYKLVDSLAQEYNFDFLFVLQPHLALGHKPLTAEENAMLSSMDPRLTALAQDIYHKITSGRPQSEHFLDLQDVFAETTQQVWIDTGGHITPAGNLFVAEQILDFIDIEAR